MIKIIRTVVRLIPPNIRFLFEMLLAPRRSLGWSYCFTVLLRTRLRKSGEVEGGYLLFFLYFSSSYILVQNT